MYIANHIQSHQVLGSGLYHRFRILAYSMLQTKLRKEASEQVSEGGPVDRFHLFLHPRGAARLEGERKAEKDMVDTS